ncbi:fructose-6-phosphate aldolase [Roseomonas xinghualingensis]|uniref:fructose-6-phosphate aldolase n=1 Tax=Roseomonas xinghualingensis TaxID=2986475 RepID=UPI0021F0EBDC|nr:fructose-6-phosphate aldolase [Roseomonas sp. SXEYE001]MCV4208896.1 fructose-6-phosphate aldolase [Roseomonas sp. SXEYE001]
MKFFVDTAEVSEIRALAESGMLDGVTTNPSLIAKSGRPMAEVIKEICDITPGPVSAEVTATDYDGMMREGEYLGRIAPNVVIKLPLTEAGLRACKHMVNNGVMVNVTLCFSAAQALLAAKAGATFISPFVGRLDDIGQDGMQLIEDVVQIYDNYPAIKTEVLVASIRHPIHLIQAAKLGAHVATLPPSVIKSLYKHPLTDRGLEAFLADWKKTGQSIL